jgi:hypothetical protein
VLVTARHEATGAIDWAANPIHPATLTYVNKVSAVGFEACSTTMHVEGVSSKDDTLVWSYLAFGAHVADTKVVTTTHIGSMTTQDANEQGAQAAQYNPDKSPEYGGALSNWNGSPEGADRIDATDPSLTSARSATAQYNKQMQDYTAWRLKNKHDAKHTGGDQGQTEDNSEPRSWKNANDSE